ncbi:EpsG family protein [Allosphingosinicella indica]|uniref:EpsG family protein n=1 Tax=Allosphingosinicella indica TaxID=941907 RepID=A0A1X7G1J5_9SPHN|nr:EpsG family protein [Allosphingosinicella indica]SMF62218.1 EpsG family protein [Allosphingosinicella indica]
MFPYWVLFSAYAIGSVGNRLGSPETARRSMLFALLAGFTVLFIGLRYQVGADWDNYEIIYDTVSRMSWDAIPTQSDPAYMALNAVAYGLDLDIWFVNLICAAIFIWGLSQFAKRQPNPWLAFVVAVPYLVIVVGMGYTRQAVAIGLVMASIGRFEGGRYVRFILLVILAAAFHKSSIIVLPLIALSAVRHRFVIYATAAAMAAILFLLFLDVFLDAILSSYFETEMSSQGAAIRVAMNIPPALLFLAFQKRFVISEQERLIWRNFSFAVIASIAGLAVASSSTVVDRLALYLIPLQIFVLSRLPYAFPIKRRENIQLLIGVFLYSAAVQVVWLLLADHAEYWLPYQVSALT